MAKCRHKRKRQIMATADYVEFTPDQEPFTPGVIECSGVSTITVQHLIASYCPKCGVVTSIDADGECTATPCQTGGAS